MKDTLNRLVRGEDLSGDEVREVIRQIMAGEMEHATVAGILMGLAAKGPTAEELAAAAEVMRAHATHLNAPDGAIDTCGTGGDGISTYNVSTTAAIIAAAAGAVVAKHGSKSNTRRSGSSEVLSALGVNIEAELDVVQRCLDELGFTFLYALRMHPAMKHVAPIRKALPILTIFNLLGPLSNPCGVRRQLLGVNREEYIELVAQTLQRLGAERAMVVHGADGLCDLSIDAPTTIAELRDGEISVYTVKPEDFNVTKASLSEIMVDSPQASADMVRKVLSGTPGPARDIAVLNAAAALVVADKAPDLVGGVEIANEAIDSGAAEEKLAKIIEFTTRP